MIHVTGRVFLNESGAPIPGLSVEAFDLTTAPKASTRTALSASDASWVTAQRSLGSDITAEDGSFGIEAEDSQSGQPVKLAIAVLKPDSASKSGGAEILHVVRRVRVVESAGAQRFQIGLPAASVTDVPATVPPDAVPSSTVTAAAGLLEGRAKAFQGVRKTIAAIRKSEADKLRVDRDATESKVTKALYEQVLLPLKDSKGALPDHVVRLNESVRVRTRTALSASLQKNRSNVARGLVDISEDDKNRLLDANGVPRATVTDADVEALLFGPTYVDGLPTRHRRDIVAVGCRDRQFPIKHQPGGPGNGSSPGDGSGASGGEATLGQVKKSLARLLKATEQTGLPLAFTDSERPTAADIEGQLQQFRLREGPADTTAQFDFERLFLASDMVIRPRPDPGLIDEIVHGTETISDLGGDVKLRQRQRGSDLLDALQAEVSIVAKAGALTGSELSEASLAHGSFGYLDAIDGMARDSTQRVVRAVSPPTSMKREVVVRDHRGESGKEVIVRDHRGEFAEDDSIGFGRARYADLAQFLSRIRRLRSTPYPFVPFGVDPEGGSVTYGVLLTYTQTWRPLGHQAGDLVKTIPLAPKASIKYHVRRKVGRTYTDKRAQSSESTYSNEAQDTQRDIAKVVRNAKLSTSFTLTNETGGGVPGVASSSTTSVFTAGAEQSSESTKEAFREQIRKHAEQMKVSSSTEVTVSSTEEMEVEETTTLENPSVERTFTCFLYELWRRFEVSERLTRATPVVLVAEKLPEPSELDEAWILRYDWILRRVVLDRDFLPAIDYASTGRLAADLGKAKELEVTLEKQTAVVVNLQQQVTDLRSPMGLPDPRNAWEQFIINVLDDKDPDWRQDPKKVREVFGDDVADRMEKRKEALKEAESDLKREASLLERATDAFNAAFTKYALEAIQVERFLLHLKDNIVYYCQAILDHEGRDQEYMRLRNQPIPDVTGSITYKVKKSARAARAPTFIPPLAVEATANLQLGADRLLGDVADLAAPLGYVGNAQVFPVRRWNPLTQFMLVPFSNAATGVTDPDDRGNITIAELSQLIQCLHEQLPKADFQTLEPGMKEAWKSRIGDPRADSIQIAMPTGSLIMEGLPGAYSLIDDFQLLHRALDVQQVANDVVGKRLEHLRLAARLTKDVLEDPDTEKVIIRDGAPTVIDTG